MYESRLTDDEGTSEDTTRAYLAKIKMAFNQDGNPHVKDGKPVEPLRFPGDVPKEKINKDTVSSNYPRIAAFPDSNRNFYAPINKIVHLFPEKTPEKTWAAALREANAAEAAKAAGSAAGPAAGAAAVEAVAAAEPPVTKMGSMSVGGDSDAAAAPAAAAAATATRKKTVAPKVHSHDDLVAVRRKGERSIGMLKKRRVVPTTQTAATSEEVEEVEDDEKTLDFDAKQQQKKIKSTPAADDLVLRVRLTGGDEAALCCGYTELGSVKEGLQAGMRVIVPLSAKGVVTLAQNGPLLDEEKKCSYSFNEEWMKECLKSGIDQPICTPSGGANRFKTAYLDYEDMLPTTTAHLRLVFVKPDDLYEYRCRYPNIIFVQLPTRRDTSPEGAKSPEYAKVGDARFWIKVFMLRLLTDARGPHGTEASRKFFERYAMIDDDNKRFYDESTGEPVPLKEVLRTLSDFLKKHSGRAPGIVGLRVKRQYQAPTDKWILDPENNLDGRFMSIQTDVRVQFHPYAQLAEDSDFDERVRARCGGESSIKCNRFSVRAERSGSADGAARTMGPFSHALVNQLIKRDFDPKATIYQVGSWPYLKEMHHWSWYDSSNDRFSSTDFEFVAQQNLHRPRQISQCVILLVPDEHIPKGELGGAQKPCFCMATLESVEKKLSRDARVLVIMPAPKGFQGPSADLALPWLPAVVGDPSKPRGTRRYCFRTMKEAVAEEHRRAQARQAAQQPTAAEYKAAQKKGEDYIDSFFD